MGFPEYSLGSASGKSLDPTYDMGNASHEKPEYALGSSNGGKRSSKLSAGIAPPKPNNARYDLGAEPSNSEYFLADAGRSLSPVYALADASLLSNKSLSHKLSSSSTEYSLATDTTRTNPSPVYAFGNVSSVTTPVVGKKSKLSAGIAPKKASKSTAPISPTYALANSGGEPVSLTSVYALANASIVPSIKVSSAAPVTRGTTVYALANTSTVMPAVTANKTRTKLSASVSPVKLPQTSKIMLAKAGKLSASAPSVTYDFGLEATETARFARSTAYDNANQLGYEEDDIVQ